jgi:hypothetical protein
MRSEECTFSIPLAQWDIALLMITARDDDVGKDQLIGYWGCPLRSLKKGECEFDIFPLQNCLHPSLYPRIYYPGGGGIHSHPYPPKR